MIKMDDPSAPILTQAKREYTSQLISILTPQIFDGICALGPEMQVHYLKKRKET